MDKQIREDILELWEAAYSKDRIVEIITDRYPAIGEFSVRSYIRVIEGEIIELGYVHKLIEDRLER